MNLYLITRTDKVGYDQYDAFVVAASNAEEAEQVLAKEHDPDDHYSTWSNEVKIELIGIAIGGAAEKPQEILGSFNAG